MADSRQQTSPAEASAFGQDDIKNLHVGLLLFSSRDFFAIKDTLLPHRKVSSSLRHTFGRCLAVNVWCIIT